MSRIITIVFLLGLFTLNSSPQILAPILFGTPASSFTPFDVGFNFRATSGYVTDLSPDTYSLGVIYPETRGGATFGFSSDLTGNSRNRDNTTNAHFAGLVFDSQNQVEYFRVDIVAGGTYSIRMAIGDYNNLETGIKVVVKDTTSMPSSCTPSASATVTGSTTVTFGFLDALASEYTATNWPASNTANICTFTTGQMRFYIGDGTNATGLAYIRITRTA